jgi:LPS sulfotransferase NodH
MRREHFWLWEPQRNVGDLYARRALLYFCRELVRTTRTPNGVFGVKLMWPHLSGVLRGLRELDEFRGRSAREIVESMFPAPRFVWIRRQDRVAQAVSFYRATMTNVWRVLPDGHSGRPPMRPILPALPYDFDAIARRLRTIEKCEAAWATFLAGQRLPFLEVTYEEVAADLRGTVLRVLDFMGVAVDPGRIQPVPSVTRMGGVESAEWTARFRAELAAGRSAIPTDRPR